MSDRIYVLRVAAVLSWREYRVQYPLKVLVLSVLPRALLQVAFFAYLGYVAAGRDGRTFGFVGAAAQVIAVATVVKGPDLLLDERVLGTLDRHRLGVVPLPLTVAVRWWIYTVEGVFSALVAILVLAVPFGGAELLVRLLAVMPLFLLVAAGLTAFGLAVGSFALTQRADVLLTNLASYALLVLCGVVAPVDAFGHWLSLVVRALPLTNGLLAIRRAIAGDAWLPDALLELAVAAAWALAAAALLVWQERHARSSGSDDRY